jgi:hypothetical protein
VGVCRPVYLDQLPAPVGLSTIVLIGQGSLIVAIAVDCLPSDQLSKEKSTSVHHGVD